MVPGTSTNEEFPCSGVKFETAEKLTKISPTCSKSHPLKALWEDEETQAQVKGRTGTALLLYPGKSNSSSQPLTAADLSTHP